VKEGEKEKNKGKEGRTKGLERKVPRFYSFLNKGGYKKGRSLQLPPFSLTRGTTPDHFRLKKKNVMKGQPDRNGGAKRNTGKEPESHPARKIVKGEKKKGNGTLLLLNRAEEKRKKKEKEKKKKKKLPPKKPSSDCLIQKERGGRR